MCFDMVNNLPETNALQNGMRKVSGGMIMDAERDGAERRRTAPSQGRPGMMGRGNIAPNGKPMPAPDMLLLSYTGCFTFMKWFELLRHEYKCPTVMLQIPYQGDGKITKNMRDFVVKQLKEEVIPMFEKVSASSSTSTACANT
jgi:benzoyl-CoA reductase subunit B